MHVTFGTKEKSKREQEHVFLALSPHERFLNFMALSKAIKKLYPNKLAVDSGNFIIDLSKRK